VYTDPDTGRLVGLITAVAPAFPMTKAIAGVDDAFTLIQLVHQGPPNALNNLGGGAGAAGTGTGLLLLDTE
jgi:hypothetical protein